MTPERWFRQMLAGVELVSVILDTRGRVVFANDFLIRLSGWRGDEIVGSDWFADFLPQGPDNPKPVFLSAIREGNLPAHYENEIPTRAGERRLIRWSNTLLRTPEGKIRGTASIGEDVTDRRRIERELKESKARLQLVTRRLIQVQETERRAVASELHDEVGSELIALRLNLQALRSKRAEHRSEEALRNTLALVDRAIHSVRSLSLDLRPTVLDDLGLVPALKWYCERQAQRSGVRIVLDLEATDLRDSPELESACFRIVQGSVTNAIRHAVPKRIDVLLRHRDADFEIEVRDDGRGFDVASARGSGLAGASVGLLGMEERATLLGGRFSIESAAGAGTKVRVRFAVPSGEASDEDSNRSR
jgi:PAS domain S-box-containing protein